MAPPAGPANAVGERDLRAERILDAAGELLIAWGYRRVTIEDVARRAGIGKGTVYLHFSTKEVLFITVLMRAQARMMGVILDEMRADPAAVLPSRMATAGYLRVREEPLLRALLTGDMETLGTLARTAPAGVAEVYEMRLRTLREYFALLRRHGLVRADQPAEAQVQAYMSVLLGFLTAEPFLPPGAGGAKERAPMLAHVIGSAFETEATPERLRAAAPEVIALFDRLRARIVEEIDRHRLTKPSMEEP